MTEPLVSVIMPVYNAANFLEKSVQSVLQQSYSNFELILIDDASTDNSNSIASQLGTSDSRIKCIALQVNAGPGIARNEGIKIALGKYIAFIDADDRWHPKKLLKQVAFMEMNDYLFTYTYYNAADKNGIVYTEKISAPTSVNYKQLLKHNVIGNLTAMYNCEAIGKIYMPPIRMRQDWGLWLDILKKGVIAYCLPEILATYRSDGYSLSANKWKVWKYNWIILREYQKLPLLSSIWYFLNFIFFKGIKFISQ